MENDRTKFDLVLATFGDLTEDCDDKIERVLYLLMAEHREAMPALETMGDYAYFHKAFRQVDVMHNGGMDIVFHHLLSHSVLFWKACNEVFVRDSETKED